MKTLTFAIIVLVAVMAVNSQLIAKGLEGLKDGFDKIGDTTKEVGGHLVNGEVCKEFI